MKRQAKILSAILSSVLLLSMTAPMTAFAAEDAIVRKDITAYLYSMENTETLSCIFVSSMPDMPYISTVDFLSNIFEGTAAEEKNDDGTYTVTIDSTPMVIDTENDTVHFDEFEVFMSSKAIEEGTALDSPYCHNLGAGIEGETNSLTIDLGEYDIDILDVDGRSYFPASFLSLMFTQTYNAAEYLGDSIYFIHCSDLMTGSSYLDRTGVYEDDHRSQAMIDLTYHELCFAVDKLYGRPSKAEIADSIEEKGFDKTLDEYSDNTRTAKEKLLSDSKADFVVGLSFLDIVFFDGGHTLFSLPLNEAGDNYADGAVGRRVGEITSDYENPDALAIMQTALKSMAAQGKLANLKRTRSEAAEKYEVIRTWDDGTASQLLISGDTAVFSFNSFMNEAVDNFKWSLDYAKSKGIKRFVLDVSCNTGGNSNVVMYMIAMMTNKNRDNNTAYTRTITTLNENINRDSFELDLNLDGEFNELDKEVYYDFEYAVLTSGVSFSCGNMLPAIAKDNGIAVIGETSGGGSCVLLINFTAEVMPYSLSGYKKLINLADEDIDSGVTPDYVLTKETINKFGETVVDYSGMYDFDAIGPMIDEFYGVTSEPSEEPSEESSEEPSEEPSEDNSDMPSDTSSERSVIIPDGNDTPATGDHGFAAVFAFLTVIASGAVVYLNAVSKKKERS